MANLPPARKHWHLQVRASVPGLRWLRGKGNPLPRKHRSRNVQSLLPPYSILNNYVLAESRAAKAALLLPAPAYDRH